MEMQEINLRYCIGNDVGAEDQRVYRVYDRQLDREVRMRIIEPSERFGRIEILDAYFASRRPSVKRIDRYIDAGKVLWIDGQPVIGGDYFLVSAWDDSPSLAKMLPSYTGKLRRILFETAVALRELAAHSATHGDLRPDNVLLSSDGVMLVSSLGQMDCKSSTAATELEDLVESLRKKTEIPEKILHGPRKLLEEDRRPRAGSDFELYSNPSVYHLGLEEPRSILLKGINYAATAGKSVAHTMGFWDHGLYVVLDESVAIRQINGSTVLPIDSKNERWSVKGHRVEFLDRLRDRSLLGPLEVHYRHDPLATSPDGFLQNLIELADVGRIRLLVASEEILDIGDCYKIPLRLRGDPNGVSERIWPGISGSETSKLPPEASAFEVYQLLKSSRNGTGDNRAVSDSSLRLVAGILPGVPRDVADSARLGNLDALETGNCCYSTRSRSGKRLWATDYSRQGSAKAASTIANILSQREVRRIHELEFLARHADDKARSANRLLEMWNDYKRLYPQEDWLRISDCALSLAKHMPEEGKRRLIVDLLYQGCSDGVWNAGYHLSKALEDRPENDLVSLLAAGWSLYSSDRRTEARSVLERILDNPERLDAEKLRLCSRLLCLISATSAEASLSEPLMGRLQEIAEEIGDEKLLQHLLIEKVILLLRKEVRPEYWKLLEEITPPDDSDQVLGIRYWWLMSLEDAVVNQPSPESKMDMLDHAMYLARLIDDRGTVLNLMNNKAISGLREGSLTYSESIDAMRDIGEKVRSMLPENMGIAYKLNITWKLNTISSSVHLMRMRKAEQWLSSVLSDTGLGYSRMPNNAATNAMRMFVSQGKLDEAEAALRAIASHASEDVIQPYFERLQMLQKGTYATPEEPLDQNEEIIPIALIVNALLADGHISRDQWLDVYRNVYNDLPLESAVNLLRKGDLLDGYIYLTAAWCRADEPTGRIYHREPLLKAIDKRYRKAGLVLSPEGNTPLQLATDEYSKLNYPIKRGRSQKLLQMLSCGELSESLAEQMDLDIVRVISREMGEFREVDGYGGDGSPVGTSWLRNALVRARESGGVVQLPGSGWRKGCPRPGIIVAPIRTGDVMKEVSPGETFFSVERIGPGKALPARLLDELFELSGFLVTVAMLRRRETALRYDELTGLLTRKSWMETVESQLSWKKNLPAVIVMVDLDGLKEINDSLGHDWGDRAISAVADHLSLNVRSSDLVGRYGGDEFVIFLPTTKKERLKELLKDVIVGIGSKKVLPDRPLSISVGYATIVHPDEHLSLAISRADRGLYKSKSDNRGSYSTVEL
ncbi:diguanylate cyclase [Candidatus Fermentibacteria bacterium]|nr:diguanylate cyclase [Candidatus Fermentibacteria bacterium]